MTPSITAAGWFSIGTFFFVAGGLYLLLYKKLGIILHVTLSSFMCSMVLLAVTLNLAAGDSHPEKSRMVLSWVYDGSTILTIVFLALGLLPMAWNERPTGGYIVSLLLSYIMLFLMIALHFFQ